MPLGLNPSTKPTPMGHSPSKPSLPPPSSTRLPGSPSVTSSLSRDQWHAYLTQAASRAAFPWHLQAHLRAPRDLHLLVLQLLLVSHRRRGLGQASLPGGCQTGRVVALVVSFIAPVVVDRCLSAHLESSASELRTAEALGHLVRASRVSSRLGSGAPILPGPSRRRLPLSSGPGPYGVNLVDVKAAPAPQLRLRIRRVIAELVATEVRYVETLQTFMDMYLRPLEDEIRALDTSQQRLTVGVSEEEDASGASGAASAASAAGAGAAGTCVAGKGAAAGKGGGVDGGEAKEEVPSKPSTPLPPATTVVFTETEREQMSKLPRKEQLVAQDCQAAPMGLHHWALLASVADVIFGYETEEPAL